MDDKKPNPNNTLILREGGFNAPKIAPREEPKPKEKQGESRFDVIPCAPINEGKQTLDPSKSRGAGKTPRTNTGSTSKTKSDETGDNYIKKYLEKKRQNEATTAQQKQAQIPVKVNENKAVEDRKEDEMRARARDIQGKIAWWKQQYGNPDYETSAINNEIVDLQQALGGIDQRFWS